MEVFVDTNVWIAALIARGTCADLVEHLIAQHVIVVSEDVLSEVRRVLGDKFNYDQTQIRDVSEWLQDVSRVVPSPDDAAEMTADRDDDFVLRAAIDAGAACLVTGDSDLLEIADEVALGVIEPAEFWRFG
jgi:putative PIN family toxin of toxin-antitoxin system